ncbi:MAG: CBS domain-containing protein [Antricoccus sp.]
MALESSTQGAPILAREIMSAPAITVTPDTSAAEVAGLLAERGISGVVVVDKRGSVVGLVSEYDLLAKDGKSVADVMTTAMICISADLPIEDVRHLLVERRIRRLPVLDQGRLIGIVSRRDVMAALVR